MTLDPLIHLTSELCAVPGIAGFEQPVAALIRDRFEGLNISTSTDRIGNVTAHIPGNGPKILLFAHMDEVGLVVRKVHADGFLYVERVGGTSTHILPGQRLEIWTEKGPVNGVVGAQHQHLGGNQHAPDLAKLYVDVGTASKRETLEKGIEVGVPATYAASFCELGHQISGKALDDRLGCALLIELARRLQDHPIAADVYLSFVVQEETLLRGAEPVVVQVEPDWAVGLDSTLAFDTPDLVEDGQTEVALGHGTVIKVMDAVRGQGRAFIAHQDLRRHLEHLAVRHAIPFQREVVVGLSTAAAPLPYMQAGLPVAAVSFPLRYAHSAVEVANKNDIKATLELLFRLANDPWKG